jgi:sigma-B regulation protein RsbU (phosphoserine phosphatase)
VLIGDVEEERQGVSPTIKHLHFIQTLTNVIFVAVENKRLYQESLLQERIKKEMELASKMQSMLVPDAEDFSKNDFLHVESFYLPHFEVGGDYYDFEQLSENEFFFCIADVSGKGMSAALLMANFQASIKGYLHAGISLPDLILKLNKIVISNARGEKFITFFVGKYNYQSRVLKFVNAGHNPPFIIDNITRELKSLTNGCPGVGMLDEIPFINQGEIIIENPSKLISFTDGLTELENEEHIEIGLLEIEKAVKLGGNIENTINSLKETLNLDKSNSFLFDDITILGIDFL